MPLIRIRDVGKAGTETYYLGEYEPEYIVKKGDILIGMDGEFRCRKWIGRDALLNQRVCRLITNSEFVDFEFFFKLIQPYLDAVAQVTSSVTVAHLSSKTVSDLEFPFPPKAEQSRIVSAIESLQKRSLRTRVLLSEVEPLIGQLRQSLLRSAFNGRLTEAWRRLNPVVQPANELLLRIRTERRQRWEAAQLSTFESKGKMPPENWQGKYKEPETVDQSELPELPEGWCWAAAEEIVEPSFDIVYGIVQPGPNLDEGVPYVRGLDIQNGIILVDQLWNTSKTVAERYSRSALKGGDVLLGIIRHTKVAVVPEEISGGNMGRATARFRPSSVIQSEFLASALESPDIQKWMLSQSRGIDMPIINVGDVRRTPIPLAPKEEQKEITKRLKVAMKSILDLENGLASVKTSLTQLDQSILSKAFKGELVPQNPRDEPASELLAKIGRKREELAALKKLEKKKQKPKKVVSMSDAREELLDWLRMQKPKATFSFDELNSGVSLDYENVREQLFELLDEKRPFLKQEFDKKSKEIRFKRTAKK